MRALILRGVEKKNPAGELPNVDKLIARIKGHELLSWKEPHRAARSPSIRRNEREHCPNNLHKNTNPPRLSVGWGLYNVEFDPYFSPFFFFLFFFFFPTVKGIRSRRRPEVGLARRGLDRVAKAASRPYPMAKRFMEGRTCASPCCFK